MKKPLTILTVLAIMCITSAFMFGGDDDVFCDTSYDRATCGILYWVNWNEEPDVAYTPKRVLERARVEGNVVGAPLFEINASTKPWWLKLLHSAPVKPAPPTPDVRAVLLVRRKHRTDTIAYGRSGAVLVNGTARPYSDSLHTFITTSLPFNVSRHIPSPAP